MAIFLTDRANLIYAPAEVNGKDVKALTNSGVSITMVNKNEMPELNMTKDYLVIVYGYNGTKRCTTNSRMCSLRARTLETHVTAKGAQAERQASWLCKSLGERIRKSPSS